MLFVKGRGSEEKILRQNARFIQGINIQIVLREENNAVTRALFVRSSLNIVFDKETIEEHKAGRRVKLRGQTYSISHAIDLIVPAAHDLFKEPLHLMLKGFSTSGKDQNLEGVISKGHWNIRWDVD